MLLRCFSAAAADCLMFSSLAFGLMAHAVCISTDILNKNLNNICSLKGHSPVWAIPTWSSSRTTPSAPAGRRSRTSSPPPPSLLRHLPPSQLTSPPLHCSGPLHSSRRGSVGAPPFPAFESSTAARCLRSS